MAPRWRQRSCPIERCMRRGESASWPTRRSLCVCVCGGGGGARTIVRGCTCVCVCVCVCLLLHVVVWGARVVMCVRHRYGVCVCLQGCRARWHDGSVRRALRRYFARCGRVRFVDFALARMMNMRKLLKARLQEIGTPGESRAAAPVVGCMFAHGATTSTSHTRELGAHHVADRHVLLHGAHGEAEHRDVR